MDKIQQFKCIDVRIYKNLLYLGDPFVHLAFTLAGEPVLLVCPMRRDAFFGYFVHSP